MTKVSIHPNNNNKNDPACHSEDPKQLNKQTINIFFKRNIYLNQWKDHKGGNYLILKFTNKPESHIS